MKTTFSSTGNDISTTSKDSTNDQDSSTSANLELSSKTTVSVETKDTSDHKGDIISTSSSSVVVPSQTSTEFNDLSSSTSTNLELSSKTTVSSRTGTTSGSEGQTTSMSGLQDQTSTMKTTFSASAETGISTAANKAAEQEKLTTISPVYTTIESFKEAGEDYSSTKKVSDSTSQSGNLDHFTTVTSKGSPAETSTDQSSGLLLTSGSEQTGAGSTKEYPVETTESSNQAPSSIGPNVTKHFSP
jgi:hypothetical protein